MTGELKSAYGTDDVYGMHWLQDVDNVYGYGNAPGKCEAGKAAPHFPDELTPRLTTGKDSHGVAP